MSFKFPEIDYRNHYKVVGVGNLGCSAAAMLKTWCNHDIGFIDVPDLIAVPNLIGGGVSSFKNELSDAWVTILLIDTEETFDGELLAHVVRCISESSVLSFAIAIKGDQLNSPSNHAFDVLKGLDSRIRISSLNLENVGNKVKKYRDVGSRELCLYHLARCYMDILLGKGLHKNIDHIDLREILLGKDVSYVLGIGEGTERIQQALGEILANRSESMVAQADSLCCLIQSENMILPVEYDVLVETVTDFLNRKGSRSVPLINACQLEDLDGKALVSFLVLNDLNRGGLQEPELEF